MVTSVTVSDASFTAACRFRCRGVSSVPLELPSQTEGVSTTGARSTWGLTLAVSVSPATPVLAAVTSKVMVPAKSSGGVMVMAMGLLL